MNKKVYFLIFFLSLNLFAKEKNHSQKEEKKDPSYLYPNLVWDPVLSPYAGTSLMLTFGEGYEALLPHKKKGRGVLDILLRTGHSFLDIGFYFYTTLIQHEIFGHGAKLREFGASHISYTVGFFQGSAHGSFDETHQKNLALMGGGIEGADVMAHTIEMDVLERSSVLTRRAWSYFFSSGNQPFYLFFMSDLDNPTHDIVNYLDYLDAYYGTPDISYEDLQLYGLLDFFNPFLYYSFYSLGNYIVTGENHFKPPFIPFGKHFAYLPATRLVLTPYGPEAHFLNYMKYKDYSGKLGLGARIAEQGSSFSVNGHLNSVKLLPWLSLGAQFSFWSQPVLNLRDYYKGEQAFGTLIKVKPSFSPLENLVVQTELGYKTSGFVQGELLGAGLILRLGLGYRF